MWEAIAGVKTWIGLLAILGGTVAVAIRILSRRRERLIHEAPEADRLDLIKRSIANVDIPTEKLKGKALQEYVHAAFRARFYRQVAWIVFLVFVLVAIVVVVALLARRTDSVSDASPRIDSTSMVNGGPNPANKSNAPLRTDAAEAHADASQPAAIVDAPAPQPVHAENKPLKPEPDRAVPRAAITPVSPSSTSATELPSRIPPSPAGTGSISDSQRRVIIGQLHELGHHVVRIFRLGHQPRARVMFTDLDAMFDEAGWQRDREAIDILGGADQPDGNYMTASNVGSPLVRSVFGIFSKAGFSLPLAPGAFGPVMKEQAKIADTLIDVVIVLQ